MNDRCVSVVMPLYNAERYLCRPIESVLAQSHGDLELVVVDDGSTDASADIVDGYARADTRVRLLRGGRNAGVAAARNRAIEAASGRYVAFLDSDDWWHPDKLARQLDALDAHDAAIAYASYQRVAEDGRQLGIVRPPARVDHRDMLCSNHIGNCTGIYDRSRLGGDGRFRRIGHEDYVFWLELVRRAGGAVRADGHDATPLASYLVRKGSVSSNKLRAAGWQWRIYREVEGLNPAQSAFYMVHYVRHALGKRHGDHPAAADRARNSARELR
ncbi:glycosyltransferase family 2 protein [Luteimonas marina]|uniref:Glycosyltransferase family 2 protein n=1 Tax=Luteimonas marina TaxID=488485 RepID=A0A5C5TVC5_9GAMM|nr:glycosyltransferase family 2 protein [Luteimonas marina]TWT17252.1 glycosyltransferase family 2 protein [Luteimonas marina]